MKEGEINEILFHFQTEFKYESNQIGIGFQTPFSIQTKWENIFL